MSKIKVGDKVVFGRGKKNKALLNDYDVTIGKVYEVEECCGETAVKFSGYNSPTHLSYLDGISKITKIVS